MRPLSALVVMLAVCLGTAGLGVRPAQASPPIIGISREGRVFVEGLDGPLFGPELRWVPGDVRRTQLWVRNDSPDPADLAVRLLTDAGLERLLDRGWMVVTAQADGERRTPRRDGDTVARVRLAPGEAAELRLTARFAATADNRSQRVDGSFDLGLQLSQVGAAEVDRTPGDESATRPSAEPGSDRSPDGRAETDGLAGTGGAAAGWLLAAGVAVVVGARLLREGGRT